MTTDNNRVGPARHQARDIVDHDGFAEDNAAQNVPDGAVRADPHLLEAEFFDACLVRCDGGAFHAHAVFLDGVGGVDRDLVFRLVTLFDGEIVIFQIDVEVRQDQPFADPLPDDFRHFVAVELDDRVRNLDLGHGYPVRSN